MARQDIVLTTYDVLANEINFVEQFDDSRLRHNKRYLSPITPLLSIHWHRLCLDEAQMVGFSKAFSMAKSLKSQYCWAVTGTPMEKCASEMKNFFEFINEEPFRNQALTERIISLDSLSSDERRDFFFESISNCLWRTPKDKVSHEIGLKPPIINIEELQMSEIERDFYQQILGSMKRYRYNYEANHKHNDINLYMSQFMKLQKICSCPSVVGKIVLTSKMDTETLSIEDKMKKLLEMMIENTRKTAIGSLRSWIMAMNCSSALYIQFRMFDQAILNYRETLKFIHSVEEHFKTDSIQLFHIYYNYSRILLFYGCDQMDHNGQSLRNTVEPLHDVQDTQSDLPVGFDFNDDDQFCAEKARNFSDKYLFEAQHSFFNIYKDILESDDPLFIARVRQLFIFF